MTQTTLGVIIGNRGFFPKHLCVSGRETILKVLEAEGIRAVRAGGERAKQWATDSNHPLPERR